MNGWLGRMARARGIRGGIGALLLAVFAMPAEATRVRALSLPEMTARAERIFVGRVIAVQVGTHPRLPSATVTRVTLSVSETWKGRAEPTITFTQFGDASLDGHPMRRADGKRVIERVEGLPTYQVGEEALLFLRAPSDLGLTSPVGFEAGKIHVWRDAVSGRVIIDRGLGESPATWRVDLTRARSQVKALLRAKGAR